MPGYMPTNDLYLAILPQIHLGINNYGYSEQVITLLPGRALASEFYEDEVQTYIDMFKRRIKYFTGGHVTGYTLAVEQIGEGRVVVRVTQEVE